MGKLLNDWLFTGITVSTVLMSIRILSPRHPLAMAASTVGYGLALLCIVAVAMVHWLRQRQGREHH